MAFSDVFKRYVATTSLNGIPKIANAPTRVQRTLWALGAVVGLCCGSYNSVCLFMSYFSYDTVVSIEETLVGSPFPDVTVCNLNPLPRDEKIAGVNYTLGQYMEKLEQLRRETAMEDEFFYTLNTHQSFLQNIVEDLREDDDSFVVQCRWKSTDGRTLPCGKNNGYSFQRGSKDHHTCVTFHTDYKPATYHYSPVYGLVMLLFLNDFSSTPLPLSDVDLHTTYAGGVRVLLHSPKSLPVITLEGKNLPSGTETTMTFTVTKRSWMEYPYGDCTEREYLDEETKHFAYSKKACAEYMNQKNVINKCQSLHPGVMTLEEQRQKYPYCGKLHDDVTKTIDTIICCDTAYNGYNAALVELCKTNCTEYRYNTEVASLPWPHESYELAYYRQYINNTRLQAKFQVYEEIADAMNTDPEMGFERLRRTSIFKRNFMQLNIMSKIPELMKNIQEKPAMTVYSLIGTLGGAVNLWMGISLLTFIELIDLCYELCLQWKKQEKEACKKIIIPN